MNYIEESTLLETDDIINTDHRAFIVDINIEEYF